MMTENTENFIQLKKSNILKIGIKDYDGNDIGEHLEFDLEDLELPLKINECDIQHKKNCEWLRNQMIILDKKENHQGKYMLDWKQEEYQKILIKFYDKEMESLNLFLGENGCQKLLNGRKPYLSMYDDMLDVLKPIMPLIKKNAEQIKDKIKNKYSNMSKNVMTNE